MEQHDTFAEKYRDSRQLAFRDAVEIPTFLGMLGDVRGKSILDLGCEDGIHTRLLKNVGAPEMTGVDISGVMIQLVEEEENLHPLAAPAGSTTPSRSSRGDGSISCSRRIFCTMQGPPTSFAGFAQPANDALGQEGRMVGLIANVADPREGLMSWKRFGVEKLLPLDPARRRSHQGAHHKQ